MINATSGFPGSTSTTASAAPVNTTSPAASAPQKTPISSSPSTSTPLTPNKKSKPPLKLIIGLLVVGLAIVGGAVAFYLSGQNQDVRQQAAGCDASKGEVTCNDACGWRCVAAPNTCASTCSGGGGGGGGGSCASGWSCNGNCADQNAVNLFNSTWQDGRARWLWDAAGNTSACGGNPSALRTSPSNPPTGVSNTCSPNSPTAQSCRGQAVNSRCNGFAGTCLKNGTNTSTGYAECGCVPDTALPIGSSCTANSNCQSGLCLNNVCQTAGSGCTPGTCVNGKRCEIDPTTGGGFVGSTSCAACSSDQNCSNTSQFCSNGQCANKYVNGTACTGDNQCQSGYCGSANATSGIRSCGNRPAPSPSPTPTPGTGGATSCVVPGYNIPVELNKSICTRSYDPNASALFKSTCTNSGSGATLVPSVCPTGTACSNGGCVQASIEDNGGVACCVGGSTFYVQNVGTCSAMSGNTGKCPLTYTNNCTGGGFTCRASCLDNEVAASGKFCGTNGGQCCVKQVDNTGACTADLLNVTRCQTETSTLPRVYTCKAVNGGYAWVLNPGPNNYCGGTGISDCGPNSDYYCSNGKEAGDSCGPTTGYGICNFAGADTLGVNKSCICKPKLSSSSPTATPIASVPSQPIASPSNPPPSNPPASSQPGVTPTPTNPPAPMCIAISMSNITLASRAVPILGDAVRFTCATVQGATKYVFRVLEPGGTTKSLQATGTVSETYTISKSGKHFAQCQICTGTNGENCQAFETVNTN